MEPKLTSDAFDRVLSFLNDLYDAAESDQPYGDFIQASDLFFFSDARPADFTASLEALNSVRQHIERIEQRAAPKAAQAVTGSDMDSALACFTVDAVTQSIAGNAAAQALMGCEMPCTLDALPLNAETSSAIKQLLADALVYKFQGARTLPVSFDTRDEALVARCIKTDGFSTHDTASISLQFTLSYVLWTNELLSFAVDEYELTNAERDVLRELLKGQSQVETARILGKSKETVRAQAKSILRKFGATQMADVQTIARAYAYLGQRNRVAAVAVPDAAAPAGARSRMMDVGHLRSVEVWDYGAADGMPIVFWHGLVLGPFFSADMIAAFTKANLRVICVSRPGFGRSSPPVRWDDFNDTVTRDICSVVDQLGLERMIFWVHQAGISFACRAAGALKGRVLGAAMNGAGVPIKPHMLKRMNKTTRVAAATVLYAPKILEMMLRFGFRTWRVSGPRQFYRQFFGTDGVEQEALKDPEIARLFELGFLHTSAQVPDAMIRDGLSAMTDWEAEYAHFDFPQHWIHSDQDQILSDVFVTEFLKEQGHPPPIIFKGYGTDLLYRGFDEVFPLTLDFFRSLNPQG